MTICRHCGEDTGEESKICPKCGNDISTSDPQQAPYLVWTAKIPVVTSSIVIKQLAMALGGGILFVIVVILFSGGVDAFLGAFPWLIGIFLFLFILSLVIAWFLQMGGADGTFAVTEEGTGYAAGDLLQKINKVTLAGGALGGSLSGAGGSLINISREMDSIPWEEVRSISFQERERTVVIYRKILIAPIMLACTKENFQQVKDLIIHYAPPGTIKK